MTAYQQSRRERKRAQPLDAQRLRALALSYLGRYATSSGRLQAYLQRKISEHGWIDDGDPAVADLIEQCVKLGYIDDMAFATARAATLIRRGYGPEKVKISLRTAGVGREQADRSSDMDDDARFISALTFARRKRLGPFANSEHIPENRRKIIAAFLRAGHSHEIVSQIIALSPDDATDAYEARSTKPM